MGLNHKIEDRASHLALIFEGSFDASTIPEFTETILQTYQDHKPSKMLIDVRNVTGQLQTIERYKLGEDFSKKFVDLTSKAQLPFCRFAVLGNSPLIDPGNLGSLVANNRGANTKATTDPEEALQWLLAEPK